MANDVSLFKAVPFGRRMRDTHFLISSTYTPLNHGSFGTYPKAVRERLHEVQTMAELRPDHFMRYQAPKMLDISRAAIAAYVNAPVDEIVLVPNASTATNVVLRSLKFEPGDTLLYLSTAYGAVQKTVKYLEETTPVEGTMLTISHPLADDEVVAMFKHAIKNTKADGKNVRAALFDTVSSLPGVRTPWERLVQLCREEKVLSVVDGAHSVGQIPTDLDKVQPDFFTSNLHKWLLTPRASAVFYVPKKNQAMIRSSLPTSHGFIPTGAHKIWNPLPMGGKSPFVSLFEFVATLDPSPYYCIETALKFRRDACGGEAEIMKYCWGLSNEGGRRVADLLGTDVMDNQERSLSQSAFSNVRLPLTVGYGKGEVPEADKSRVMFWLAARLLDDHDTYVAFYFHAGSFWVRLSGQIYLELDDFLNGAQALKKLCERVRDKEYLQAGG